MDERKVQEAYEEIAFEEGLTVIPDKNGLPVVPPHWRKTAEERARFMEEDDHEGFPLSMEYGEDEW